MEKTSIEFNFLFNICKHAIFDYDNNQVNFSFPEDLNWKELLNLATRHRVRPLLFMGLKKYSYEEKLPAIFMEKLKSINFHITTKNLLYTKELIRLFQLFKNENVNVIPYKGIVLVNKAYNNLGAREFSDIDLLIDLKDFKVVKKILVERNYEWKSAISNQMEAKYFLTHCEHNFHYYQNGKRQYAIDLHWMISTKYHQLAIDYEMLMPLMNLKKTNTLKIPTLNLEGLLLTTCLHHFGKDQSHNLRNVSDIAAILNRYETEINWELLLTTAKQWKIKNIVLLGIGVTCTLFSIKSPEAIKIAMKSKKIKYHIDKHIQMLQREKHDFNGTLKYFTNLLAFHLSIREHLSTKLKIIFHFFLFLILPTSKDLEENPNSNYWFLLLSKPFRLSKDYLFSNDGFGG